MLGTESIGARSPDHEVPSAARRQDQLQPVSKLSLKPAGGDRAAPSLCKLCSAVILSARSSFPGVPPKIPKLQHFPQVSAAEGSVPSDGGTPVAALLVPWLLAASALGVGLAATEPSPRQQSLVQLPLAALASPAWLLLLGRTESPLGPPSHSVLQAEPSQIPDPRHVWSRHSLPITDMCCGFGGPLARAATASLDQTAKVRLGSEQTNVPEVCRPRRVKAWLQQSCPCGLQQLGFLAVSVMTQSCQT